MSFLFNTFLYNPLYNFLVFIIEHVPFADLGISVVILTIIVRLILLPLSKSAIRTQIRMRDVQGPLNDIKEKYKDDQRKQVEETMKLYKEKGIRPFSGIFLLLIQIPIIIALYSVFYKGGLPEINTSLLYSFVTPPEFISAKLFGIFDITKKSIVLAVLASVTQFIQFKIVRARSKSDVKHSDESAKKMAEMMETVQNQMQYIFPGIMLAIAYSFGSIVAVYFVIGNIFSIFQEIYLKKKIEKEEKVKI